MLSKSVNSSVGGVLNPGQQEEINSLKPTALHFFASLATSYFKPLETIRKSAHLEALSLSLLLVLSHSAADEDKTEMTPLKESESGGKVKERRLAPSIAPLRNVARLWSSYDLRFGDFTEVCATVGAHHPLHCY